MTMFCKQKSAKLGNITSVEIFHNFLLRIAQSFILEKSFKFTHSLHFGLGLFLKNRDLIGKFDE